MHQRSDPWYIPSEVFTRPEEVDEAIPQEAQGHASARLHRPYNWDQQLSHSFPPTIVGRDAIKLPDDKLLDLLEFGIPIKWQRQMQVQKFEPTAGTLRKFQDFCKRLESALDEYSVVQDETSKKPSGHKKGKKKRRQNTNDEDLKFCMLHGKNPTHTTEQCRTLKREVDKQKNLAKTMAKRNLPSAGIIQRKRKFMRSRLLSELR